VAAFRLSRQAETDLSNIGNYTLRTWGKAQAVRYINDLEMCCRTLASNPALGRSCDEIRPGLLRLEMANTSSFIAKSAVASWFHASSITGCCRKGILLAAKVNHKMPPLPLRKVFHGDFESERARVIRCRRQF